MKNFNNSRKQAVSRVSKPSAKGKYEPKKASENSPPKKVAKLARRKPIKGKYEQKKSNPPLSEKSSPKKLVSRKSAPKNHYEPKKSSPLANEKLQPARASKRLQRKPITKDKYHSQKSLPPERLQKVLARAGLGSRREIETWIREGRVRVNKRVATIGERVNLNDQISLNGRLINSMKLQPPPRQVLCYHKPVGEVCTRRDPEGRSTIFARLPPPKYGRWISIGRLDCNTSGLLLLTTDGELAHRLMHPSYQLEREYAVRILGQVDEAMLKRLREGVTLDDRLAQFNNITDAGGAGANHWYHVTLMEGRKHEVRRLWESQGVTVSRLIRIRFGTIHLPAGLKMGHIVELTHQQQQALLQLVGLTDKTPSTFPPSTPTRVNRRNKIFKRR
jgi:23S rRNA pseudouridine2605 synthase